MTTTPGHSSAAAPSARHRVLAALPTLLAVVLLALAARWFAARWDAVASQAARPDIAWAWIAVAFALLVVHAATALTIWRQVLAAVGASLPWREAADSWAPTLLARYVPGKVWAHAVRLTLARRAGVSLTSSTGAILWEILLALAGAGLLALLGFIGRGDGPAMKAAVALLAGAFALWAVAVLVARHPRGGEILRRVGGTAPAQRPRALLPAFLTGLVGWACFGLAHVAVMAAITSIAPADIPLIVRAVALAWAGGFLAFVVPMGLGVRDGLLLLLLAPVVDQPHALLFVALSRLVQIAVDTLLTVAWLATRRRGVTPTAVAPPSA